MNFFNKGLLIYSLIVLKFFLNAQVEHKGIFGGALHGFASDNSGQINVQIGPIADFNEPTRLFARSLNNKIPSGSSTGLEASLLLDDGTSTILDPSLVEWTFSKPELKFQNGALLAEVMPNRTEVKVQASAEGFKTSFIVFILPADTSVGQPVESALPDSLRNAVELEAKGWKQSDWFGIFYDANNGWLFHADYGWLHTSASGPGSSWFWNDEFEWFWTGPNIYPHLYRNRDAAWLYFFKEALPSKIFYNYRSQKVERLAKN